MTWFTRFTRFGEMHMVFSQENSNSCGIACVRMVVFKINKLQPRALAVRSEQSIDADYSKVIGAPYDGSAYSNATFLFKLLNQYTSGTWKAEYAGPEVIGQKLVDCVGVNGTPGAATGAPVIVLVGWSAGGAHFVVVDSINMFRGQLYASVCDPWDGNVHVTPFAPGQPFNYTGAPVPWSWSLGAPEHAYDGGPSSGAGNGWIIYKS